jgi:6-phosphogluconolactonase (cycloisomerase 2 family)
MTSDPSQTHLYVALQSAAGTFQIGTYAIDPTTGALSVLQSIPFGGAPTDFINFLKVDPAGKFLLVTNAGAGTFTSYAIAADGTLGAANAMTFPKDQSGNTPFCKDFAISPDGAFAYVVLETTGQVAVVNKDATGALTLASVAATSGAYNDPEGIAIDPAGRFVYVSNYLDQTVTTFSRDAGTGALTAVGAPLSTGGMGFGCTIDSKGQNLYVSCNTTNDVEAFKIDPATGSLTPNGVAGSARNNDAPYEMVIDNSGKFAYTVTRSPSCNQLTIDATTGALTQSDRATLLIPPGSGGGRTRGYAAVCIK